MRVLLSHSYFLRFDPKALGQHQPYPPLGTLYAASVMRNAGHDVALFDVMLAEREDEIAAHITRHRPDVVVFFEDNFNYLSKMCLSRMREACFRMAAIAKRAGCLVIAQGSDPGDHLEAYFGHDVDHVIIGEGEQTLIALLDHVRHSPGAAPAGIEGIAYRDGGRVVQTPRRAVIRDLDALPFPAWDLIDLAPYRSMWLKHHGYFSLNLITTRGCPFHCNWCAKPVYGQVYNARSARSVAQEQQLLKEHYGAQHIWFADDIFGLKPGWINEYADAVSALGAKLPFKIQSRVDLLLQEDNIRNLARAGCEEVWVGAESGSQRILDAMDKGTTVEQIYDATRLLKQHGIRVAFFLQYGFIGETIDDIRKTRRMVRDLMPDNIGISVSYPLPGTKFYDMVAGQLGEKRNWATSGDLDVMYRGTYSPAFYRALHSATHKEYRLRQSIIALFRGGRLRAALRGIIAIPWYAATFLLHRTRMALAARG